MWQADELPLWTYENLEDGLTKEVEEDEEDEGCEQPYWWQISQVEQPQPLGTLLPMSRIPKI